MSRTALYRHFDAAGRLLYVGISMNSIKRLGQHRVSAEWFVEIASVKIEWLPSRQAALTAEAIAIARENPKWNKARPAVSIPAEKERELIYAIVHPLSGRVDGWYCGRNAEENALGVLEYFRETWPNEQFHLWRGDRHSTFPLTDSRVLRGTNAHLWASLAPARAFAQGD